MARQKKSTLEKETKKVIKKTNPFVLILFVIIFIGFCAGGYFVANFVTEGDKFEIVGDKVITLTLGETYEDEGAIAISFKKDISSKITTEDNIDYTQVGQYYIKYKVDDIRYKGVYRYRTIIIEEVGGQNA